MATGRGPKTKQKLETLLKKLGGLDRIRKKKKTQPYSHVNSTGREEGTSILTLPLF